jgi:hypothetical protein
MGFCAICGRSHDPGTPCFGRAGQSRRETGGVGLKKKSKEEIKKTLRSADKFMLKLLLVVVGAVLLVSIVVFFLQRHR